MPKSKLSILLFTAFITFGTSGLSYAQYLGPNAQKPISTVAEILKNPVDDQQVVLHGYLIKQVGVEKYLFADDSGEITGLFPTVSANWRWANCCTDGALIGNVGCDNTFDFYPNFPNGITDMKWVSGTLASPVYTSFNNISDPIRIQCGDSNPSCCPNSNIVNML